MLMVKLNFAMLSDILGRTVIIVSNRLYQSRLCNKIFVLDDGKISQMLFENLKLQPGFFAETFQKQTSYLVTSKYKTSKKSYINVCYKTPKPSEISLPAMFYSERVKWYHVNKRVSKIEV